MAEVTELEKPDGDIGVEMLKKTPHSVRKAIGDGAFLLLEKPHFPTDTTLGAKLLRETRLYLRPTLAAIIGSEAPLNEIESDLLAQEISDLAI